MMKNHTMAGTVNVQLNMWVPVFVTFILLAEMWDGYCYEKSTLDTIDFGLGSGV
jgi:hypothetical protein